MLEITTDRDTTTDRDHPTLCAEEAWLRLRTAIAEEYIAKLPDLLEIDEFARLAGLTIEQVRCAVRDGELVLSLRGCRRGISPADNVAFLARERLLHLTRAAPVG